MKKNNSILNVIKEKGFVIYPTKGISMLPLLVQDDTMVKIEKLNKKPNLYDCVLFIRNKRSYVLHRVVKLMKHSCLIVGDNSNSIENIRYKDIIGVMTGYYRDTTYFSIDSIEYQDYLKKNIIGKNYKDKTLITPFKELNPTFSFLLRCIKASIKDNKKLSPSDDVNLSALYKMSKSQSISPTIFYSLDTSEENEKYYNLFKKDVYSNIKKQILFESEKEHIIAIFKNNNIECIPFKGSNLSKLYPNEYERVYADIDIFIKNKEKRKVRDIFVKEGYKVISFNKYVHDTYQKEPVYNFEIHNKLFPDNLIFHSFFNNLFIKEINNKTIVNHTISDNDFYLYFIAHENKHAINGGIGLRTCIDLYLMREKLELDYYYIEKVLVKESLKDFHDKIIETTYKIFDSDESTKFNYYEFASLFESGTYGTLNQQVNRTLESLHGSKFKYILSRVFLPYGVMKSSFPIIRYVPILYPFMIIYRIIRLPFKKDSFNHFKSEINIINSIDE